MAQVIIMRGLPGSGKSSWIKNNYPSATVVSADHYRSDANGVYKFDLQLEPTVHNACLTRFVESLASLRGNRTLVVDNTNLQSWEVAPYYRLAEINNFEVTIVHLHCQWEVAAGRTVHGVPVDKVLAMHRSTGPLPVHWNVRDVY